MLGKPVDRERALVLLALALPLAAAGCASALPNQAGTGSASDATARITVGVGATKGYVSQAIVHRWVAADIVRFDLSLAAAQAPGTVVASTSVPARGGQAEAMFSHLRAGHRYLVSILALGNVGATARMPLQTLDTQTATTVELDFTAAQNLADALQATASVTLDSAPFAGSLTIDANPPAGTATVSASLFDAQDPAHLLDAQTFGGSPGAIVFHGLAAGVSYLTALTAYQDSDRGVEIATASAAPFSFDPQATDLSTSAAEAASRWSPWQLASPSR